MKRLSLLPWLMLLLTGLLGSMPNARANETVTLVMTDAQGTPVVETDIHGTVLARYAYRPYGTSVGGPLPAGPGYTGHVNDPDTGLVYMQQRYYDPEVGRFPSPDPVGPVPGNVFNINRYAYANNNPIRYTDPDGQCPICIGAGIGAVVGLAVEGYRQFETGKFDGRRLVVETLKGGAVGGLTVATGGAIAGASLGLTTKVLAIGGSAFTIGAAGNVAATSAEGGTPTVMNAVVGGLGNVAGVAAGSLAAPLAKAAATTVTPAVKAFPVKSLTGRVFYTVSTEAKVQVNNVTEEAVKSATGEGAALEIDIIAHKNSDK